MSESDYFRYLQEASEERGRRTVMCPDLNLT